jgi:hypothetical protein
MGIEGLLRCALLHKRFAFVASNDGLTSGVLNGLS